MSASKIEANGVDVLRVSDFVLKGKVETETNVNEDMSIHIPRFCLRAGEITAIIGGSGCGKSVFLSLVMGCPAFGVGGEVEMSEFCMFGRQMSRAAIRSFGAMARWRRQLRDFGGLFYLPQAFPVSKTQWVHVESAMVQVVQALISPINKSKLAVRAAIEKSFCEHGLDGVLKKNMSELSGGERRRAELLARFVAMKLAQRPAILILDEPTTGFDPANAQLFIRDVRMAIDGLRCDGVAASALFSTHEMSCLDDKCCGDGRRVVDRISVVHRDGEGDGRGDCVLLFDGPPETLWRQFFPNCNDGKRFASDGELLFEKLKGKSTCDWLAQTSKEAGYVA